MADTGPASHIEHVHLVASRPVWAIIGVLAGIIVGGFGYWLNLVQDDTRLTKQQIEAVQANAQRAGERMAAFEAHLDGVRLSQGRIEDALRDVNQKLDRFLEKGK